MKKCKTCEHIKRDDTRCGSPALRGKPYCFYHNRMHTGDAIRNDHPCRLIPTLKNARNIQVAATQVLHDALAGRLTAAETRTLMNIIRLASNTLASRADFDKMLARTEGHRIP